MNEKVIQEEVSANKKLLCCCVYDVKDIGKSFGPTRKMPATNKYDPLLSELTELAIEKELTVRETVCLVLNYLDDCGDDGFVGLYEAIYDHNGRMDKLLARFADWSIEETELEDDEEE